MTAPKTAQTRTWSDLQADQAKWLAEQPNPSVTAYERRWAKLVIDHRPQQDWCWAIPARMPGNPYDTAPNNTEPGNETVIGHIQAWTLYSDGRNSAEPAKVVAGQSKPGPRTGEAVHGKRGAG